MPEPRDRSRPTSWPRARRTAATTRSRGERINVEFISANPTGPLHLGHTRWAAVGDAIARVLEAAGAEVDPGVLHQRPRVADGPVRRLDRGGRAGRAGAGGRLPGRLRRRPGRSRCSPTTPGILELPEPTSGGCFREAGYPPARGAAGRSSPTFRTHFDVWFSERVAARRARRSRTASRSCATQGHVYDADGALWMRTTDFGDDKDRVLIRSNGELTYFASDTAYYVDKRERGFDRCIYLLGADHHGYVGRLRAMAACAGDDPDRNIEVLIGQLVKIMQGGEELRLSKRAGTLVTLRGAGRPDRRGRAALHPGAVSGRLAADPRRRRR